MNRGSQTGTDEAIGGTCKKVRSIALLDGAAYMGASHQYWVLASSTI